jgi:amino acid transporter
MALKRDFTTVNVYFAAISSAIGSGWLFAPYYAAKIAGPLAIVAWIAAALLIFPILLSFMMMATRYPVTGSLVRFTQATHGNLLSFMCGWLTWLAAVMVPAVETMASLDYSSYFFPSLVHKVNGNDHLTLIGIAWACLIMVFFMITNLIGIKLVAKINSTVSSLKIIIPGIFIVVGLCYLHPSNFHISHVNSQDVNSIFQAIATGGILFSLIGFRTVFEMSGEIKNPKKTLFRGMLSGFFTYVAIYILLQIAFVGILNPKDFAGGWQHLNLMGGDSDSPLISIVASMGLIWMVGLLYIDAVLSPGSTGLITYTSTARVLYSMSATGFLPKRIVALNKRGVPWIAIIINFVVGMLFFFPFSGWETITSFFAALNALNYGLGIIAMPVLCYLIDKKTHLYQHVIGLAAIFCAMAFIYFTGWSDVWLLVTGSFAALVLYISYCFITKRHEKNSLHNVLWLCVMLICSLVISYFGQFGGGTKALSLGASFGCLALSAFIVYWLGLRARRPSEQGRQLIANAMAEEG